ncbi:MAG TPA: ABC transporter ATP-binding protein [Mycobacteriales bacterium]|jgi:peptide/nickel transport system ATP-binding protein|nr:ABC transporter ATP-binding protein [Mycobacteriales bacterium]
MHENVLEVQDLTVRYRTTSGDRTAVDGVNLEVRRGEILGIAGESGCGKTTLATTVLRLLKAPGYIASGGVVFHPEEGEPIDLLALSGRRLRAVRWSHLSYLPQGSMNSLNPVANVKAQFVDVIREHTPGRRTNLDDRVADLLHQVGLPPEVAGMFPHELSGGMKQRVIMAIAVALEPDLLIADEPTTALDVTVQRLVLQNLAELREKFGVTLAVITHDMGVHAQLVDRVAVMSEGKVVEVGDVKQIFAAPAHPYTQDLIASIPNLDVHQRDKAGTHRAVEEQAS